MTFLQSTCLAMALVSAGVVPVQGAWAEGRSLSESSPSKVVTGEGAQVKGEFQLAKDSQGDVTLDIVDKSYVITSQAGEAVRLNIDDKTKVRNRVNPGDKVVAKISSEGQTLSVTRLGP
jgi:hypothetical protein